MAVIARLREGVRTLSPGYFALTMATGIVSIGLAFDHQGVLSRALMRLTGISFALLCVLNAWRFLAHRHEFVADALDPAVGFGYFAFVAAADVLAARIAAGHPTAADVLLGVATVAWVVRAVTANRTLQTRPVLDGVNGTWFLAAVGAQSVSVAAAILGDDALAVVAWAIGSVLYLAVLVVVLLLPLGRRLAPEDLTPPYWITMGAAAISVVAGSQLSDTVPFAAGLSIGLWVVATILLPALVVAFGWRHLVRRVPLTYDPSWWSLIFPLGMYAVASHTLARAEHLPWLATLGSTWVWLAFGAWLVCLVAMLRPRRLS